MFVDLVIWQFHGQSSPDLLVHDMSHCYRPKSSHTSHCYRPTSSCIRSSTHNSRPSSTHNSRPSSTHNSRCYRPSTAARCTVTDQFKIGATDIATVQATWVNVTDPIQELLLQTPFKPQKPTVTHPVQDRNHCYRPSTSHRDWSKLQGLFYDILPWRKMPENDARNVKLIQTIGGFRPS